MSVARWFALLGMGCGRVGFEPVGLADAAAGDDAAELRRCDVSAPFTSIRHMTELDLGGGIRSGAPRPTADELTIYFHAGDGVTTGLYSATRSTRDVEFGVPTALDFTGAWPTVTADGLTLYYDNTVDVFVTSRPSTAASFVSGVPVSNLATANVKEEAALLSSDGATMYLAQQNDIASLPWPSAQAPTLLLNLSSGVVEHAAAISSDELTIYFDRNAGGPKLDLFVATRGSTSEDFGVAVSVPELNSPENESPAALSADGCRLYFESDRLGIYQNFVAEREPL